MADDLNISEMEVEDLVPQKLPLSADQVNNSAGGFVWKVDDLQRLRRFLCLGSEKGTYYITEKQLGLENAKCILKLIENGKGLEAVDIITQYSVEGRTAKQNPIIFALAVCARQNKDEHTKQKAYMAVQKVCRIPTHLFMFIQLCEKLSHMTGGTGWGRAHRRAISNWYNQYESDAMKLAMHVTKYRNREGWTHTDVMRLAHLKPGTESVAVVARYIIKGIEKAKEDFQKLDGNSEVLKVLEFLQAVEELKAGKEEYRVVQLIQQYGLVREHVPTSFLSSTEVWQALLTKMPMTAMIRNLGKMTSIGLLSQGSAADLVINKLQDEQQLKYARIHPFNILVALKQYAKGKGDKGKLTWEPNKGISDALDRAFYKCFKNVKPTNKRYLLAVDVSGSMGWGCINGSESITPMDGAAAMALVTASIEPHHTIVGFSTDLVPLPISPDLRLDAVVDRMQHVPMGGTDCAQPMMWAKRLRKEFDVFIVYTDNETWFGKLHPAEALRLYRKALNLWESRLIVVGMASNGFTIADPEDPGMMDMVGFDSAAPEAMNNFIMGHM